MGLLAHSMPRWSAARISIDLLEDLLADYPKRDFQVRLWDGSTWGAQQQPSFVLVLRHPGALREMFLEAGEISMAQAYLCDDFDVEGDFAAAFDLADYLLEQGHRTLRQNLRLAGRLHKLPAGHRTEVDRDPAALHGQAHSIDRDRRAVRYHYDLPPEFFALWLDRRMQYSSAYFARGETTDLETAQRDKLDYICRKLRLHAGDRFLDVGCGWGGLLIHATACYGVEGVGITLSVPQAELARQRICESGLQNRCRVEVCDYRDLEVDQQFDKIASIGMSEHVGESRLGTYFETICGLIRPGGVFLNSAIAAPPGQRRQEPSFIDRYVFPDGELVPLSVVLGAAERKGLEVRDVENLGEHYALTLHQWVKRLQAHADEARRIVGEATYRVWRLYMSASEHRFRLGHLNLYQVLLAKRVHGRNPTPLTREDWYRKRPGDEAG